VSLLPRNEWQSWAQEWGLVHHPQKGWIYRNEQVVGLYKGVLVQAGWGGENNLSLIVRLRFPRTTNPEVVKQALVEDPSLDSMPGHGAKRAKMAIETGPQKRVRIGGIPEFTLTDTSLVWFRAASLNGPKPRQVPEWVGLLAAALARATPGYDGRCEQCGTDGVKQFVLLDESPAMICPSCRQRLRAEGEMAERAYNMTEARHLPGALLGAGAAVVGAVAWAFFAGLTQRIFAFGAIGIGALIAWAYRRGAGRVDGLGRAIGAALTLVSVVLGQVLFYAWAVAQSRPRVGSQLDAGLAVYLATWREHPGTEVIVLLFGLVGAWVATRALQRPRQSVVVRQPDQDPREAPRRAA